MAADPDDDLLADGLAPDPFRNVDRHADRFVVDGQHHITGLQLPIRRAGGADRDDPREFGDRLPSLTQSGHHRVILGAGHQPFLLLLHLGRSLACLVHRLARQHVPVRQHVVEQGLRQAQVRIGPGLGHCRQAQLARRRVRRQRLDPDHRLTVLTRTEQIMGGTWGPCHKRDRDKGDQSGGDHKDHRSNDRAPGLPRHEPSPSRADLSAATGAGLSMRRTLPGISPDRDAHQRRRAPRRRRPYPAVTGPVGL